MSRLKLLSAVCVLLAVAACPAPEPAEGTEPDDPTPPIEETGIPVDGCSEVASTDVTALGMGVLGARIEVELDEADEVEVSCTLVDDPPVWTQPIPRNSEWQVWGGQPPPDFAEVSFDSSSWPVLWAPVGFGDDVASEVVADSLHAFRTTFDLDDAATVQQLELWLRFDDGVVVSINGQEVTRHNVPPTTNKDAWVELRPVLVSVDASVLVTGTNVVAVELHQALPADDGAFDLRLSALVERAAPDEVHLLRSDASAATHVLELYGLLADSRYVCVAETECAVGAATDLVVAPLGIDMPALPIAARGESDVGAYTLLNHQRPCADDHRNRLLVLDPEGRVRWTYELPVVGNSSIDIESTHLGGGQFLWGGGEKPEGVPEIVALDHSVVHQAGFPGVDQTIFHHDIELLPSGEIVGFVVSEVTESGETWQGFDLLQYDPATQQVTWQWSTQAAYDAGQLTAGSNAAPDPYHANSLAVVDDGDGPGVYASLLRSDEIVRIDRATGDISWHLGRGGDFALLDPSGAALPDEDWFTVVHALEVYGDRIMVYENGRDALQSHAMEFVLDVPARTATRTWAWTEPDWYESVWGDADELPNGNVNIAMAHAYCQGANLAHPGAIVEVDRATDAVVWRLDFLDADDSTYRAERIDGCDLFANTRYCPELR